MRWVFSFPNLVWGAQRRVGILVVGGKLATFKKIFENVLENLKKTLMDLPDQNKCGKKLSFLLFYHSFILYYKSIESIWQAARVLLFWKQTFCILDTAWKASVFGVFWSAFYRFRTEYGVRDTQSECGKMLVRTLFTQLEFCSKTFAWLRMVLLLDWSGSGESLFLFHWSYLCISLIWWII